MAQKHISFHDEIRNNKIKSIVLMFVVIIFFLILGGIISTILDPSYFFIIMIFSVIFSVGYTLISYYNSDKIALSSVGAVPASKLEHRQLIASVENMAIASGLPVPKIYVMHAEEINAFATGRDPSHAVLCITDGAIAKLNKQELEGVISHEMAHIANYDVRFMTYTAVVIGLISILAEVFLRSLWFRGNDRENKSGGLLIVLGILFSILAPLLSNLVSFAISRKREFAADATGAKFTRYPPGLASALKKISLEKVSEKTRSRIPKAVAPLFISDPFKKKISGLFSTHPDINERIKRLNAM